MLMVQSSKKPWNIDGAEFKGISTILNVNRYPINGIRFNNNGTMFYSLTGNGGIIEYNLLTPYKLNTADYREEYPFDSGSTDLFFSSDGTKMFITYPFGVDVYILSTAWVLSSAIFDKRIDLSAQETGISSIFISSDGLNLYITGTATDKIHQYLLSTPWDIATATYLRTSASTVAGDPRCIYFSPDGTKLFVTLKGSVITNSILTFPLSAAWNVSTLGSSSSTNLYGYGVGLAELNFTFSEGGSTLYVSTISGPIYTFPLSSAFTTTVNNYKLYENNVYERRVMTGALDSSSDLFFSTDGTKLYTVSNSTSVLMHTLATAFDIGTATYTNGYTHTNENTSSGVCFSSNGLRMFLVGYSSDTIRAYNLSTAWDIGTASASTTLSCSAYETNPVSLRFSSDGLKMYLLGTSSDKVHQYNLSIPWALSTAVYHQSRSVLSEDSSLSGLEFSNDGTKMYICGTGSDKIHQYYLSIAWDISTAVLVFSILTTGDLKDPSGVAFNNDGTIMYTSGSLIAQYSLI